MTATVAADEISRSRRDISSWVGCISKSSSFVESNKVATPIRQDPTNNPEQNTGRLVARYHIMLIHIIAIGSPPLV